MAQSASKSCDICMSGPGRNYCEQCDQWMCDNCKTLHLRSKMCRNHTFLSGPNINPEEKPICKEHDEQFIFYCNDCDMPICKICSVKTHKKHNVSEINELTQELQAEVENVIDSKIKTVVTNIDTIEQGLETYQSQIKEAIRVITEDGKQMKQWIDKKVQALITSLEEKETVNLKAFESIKTGLRHDLGKLLKCQTAVTEGQKVTDASKLLIQLKHIKSEINDEGEKQPSVMPTMIYNKKNVSEQEIMNLFGDISFQKKYYSVDQTTKKETREVAIVSVRANVLVYDNPNKKWVFSGSGATKLTLSKVQIFRHTENNRYRVVGRRFPNHEVLINCLITKSIKYEKATPTFHQWRVQGEHYGLNFPNKEEANTFGQAMESTIDTLQRAE